MRSELEIADHWWISPSRQDALHAAYNNGFDAARLEYADEPENHPQCVALKDVFSRSATLCGRRPHPANAVDGGDRAPVPTQLLTYARRIDIPEDWRGQRVFLNLDNTRYDVTVELDETTICHYVGGLEPHRIDVTDRIQPGATALLCITVGDSGVSAKRPFDTYNYTGTRLPTCEEITDNLVHPVQYGGANKGVQSVVLECVPAVRTEYVFADPKVAAGRLDHTVCIVNDSAAPRTVRVTSEAVGARTLVRQTLTLQPQARETIRQSVDWPDAVLWDLDNPHMYELQTTLEDDGGELLDSHRDSFGFREFTINGHNYYLNGKKIHLHGQSGHTSADTDWMTLEQKIEYLKMWKERGNITHFRLHAKPQHKEWVLAADRVGLLVTTETALWTTNFASFDWVGSEEECYRNVRNHFFEALVRRDRNNPSVIVWSLSNEMSPITNFDLDNPKMAAMTRVLERIVDEARVEDSSRIIQMSSAMDFLGKLRMYNLHYPKNWQAFPDYPHTAYWLDGSFLFPWYGPRRQELPSWGWRKDKPLYFGEFTCVHGATPDNQASIVGDVAFERSDFGTPPVNEKLWPMEINAYRRLDVSGFCAWAAMFHEPRDADALFARPEIVAHNHALRPLAVIDHSYRTEYFAGDEIAIPLSIHNDTRRDVTLECRTEIRDGDAVLWSETMPAAVYGPAENKAFTSRFRAPCPEQTRHLVLTATLTGEGQTLDHWEKQLTVQPLDAQIELEPVHGVFDPDGMLSEPLGRRGIRNFRRLTSVADLRTALPDLESLWIPFDNGGMRAGEALELLGDLETFARNGGVVILDRPPDSVLPHLHVPLRNGQGFAAGNRLEITYAFNIAPHHPVMTAADAGNEVSLWGEDLYVARRTFETPQQGNAVPLLVAGTDRNGLTTAPLLELPTERGSIVVSSLEILPTLAETTEAAEFLVALMTYRPRHAARRIAVHAGEDSWRVFREVGLQEADVTESVAGALAADLAIVDGDMLGEKDYGAIASALDQGKTVYLHALSEEQTRGLLDALELPGDVRCGATEGAENDTFIHEHSLADGMTNNYLYWIVGKDRVAPWTRAPLHPEPATALIRLRNESENAAVSITRRGAVTVYAAGRGTLVVDNLRWHDPGFDEPERPRRYVMALLTNLGVPLGKGAAKRMGEDFETEAERRERGHF